MHWMGPTLLNAPVRSRAAGPSPATSVALFELNEAQRALQSEAREFADSWTAKANEVRGHALERGEIHPGFWREFVGLGYTGLMIPALFAGREQGLLATAVVLEALASRNLALPILGLTNGVGNALASTGSETLKAHYLPEIASGDTLFGLASTEAEAGHNFLRMRTLAERDGDEVVINGRKTYISGVDIVNRLLLIARSLPPEELKRRDLGKFGGLNALAIPTDLPGMSVTRVPMGERAVIQWELEFRDARVPAEELLGEEHWGAAGLPSVINIERTIFSALALGMTEYCLERSVERASDRVVFGDRSIGSYQAIQHPLAEIRAQMEAARLLVYRVAAMFDQGVDPVALNAQVNMAKFLAAEIAFKAVDRAIQTFGADGFDTRNGLLDIFVDVRTFRSQPISQELALNTIAEQVLGLPRSS